MSFSRPLISNDGTSWQPLPFATASVGERGWTLLAATPTDGGVLLEGYANERAAF